MPTKRKNTRKKANPGLPRAFGRAGSKKQAAPSLNLVLKRLDKIDQHLETLERNTAAEFKALRGETAQGFANLEQLTAAEFKAVRGEMAQGFDSLRQEFKAELQKEFEKHGDDIKQHFLRAVNEMKAENAELRDNQKKLLTSLDAAARNYDEYWRDRKIGDAMVHDVEELKKRDMEKAAAIDKIEKEIEKLKAA